MKEFVEQRDAPIEFGDRVNSVYYFLSQENTRRKAMLKKTSLTELDKIKILSKELGNKTRRININYLHLSLHLKSPV